jgi:purine catabolism regulator
MPLRLEQLLNDSSLGLELVAGREGLRRRGPVRWVHISEIPDPTPWMEGGELLLTTGIGLRDGEDQQRGLVAGLMAKGCPGVGFGLGVSMDAVPDAMLAEAERLGLPLFTVPYEVPFIAVTKWVSQKIFEEHYATLRGALDLHRQILAAVLSGGGIAAVGETFGRYLVDHDCVVFDYYGRPLASRSRRPLEMEKLWAAVAAQRGRRADAPLHVDGQIVYAREVRLGDQVEAVLAVLGARTLHEHEALLLEQGLAGVSLELARGLSVRELRRSRVDELLEDVVSGAAPVALAHAMSAAGLDPRAPFRVLCLVRPSSVPERSLCNLVEDACAGAGVLAVGRHAGHVYAVQQPAEGDQAECIAAALRERGWAAVAVGRSGARLGTEWLGPALREARVAATAPGNGGVRDIGELGLPGLLAGIRESVGTKAFVEQVLQSVLEHDAREGTQLVATLRAYLSHGCRPGPAAEELCIHRHTLAYRLDHIARLTGCNPREGRHLLAFSLALELLSAD